MDLDTERAKNVTVIHLCVLGGRADEIIGGDRSGPEHGLGKGAHGQLALFSKVGQVGHGGLMVLDGADRVGDAMGDDAGFRNVVLSRTTYLARLETHRCAAISGCLTGIGNRRIMPTSCPIDRCFCMR